jgi:hypothetical protein
MGFKTRGAGVELLFADAVQSRLDGVAADEAEQPGAQLLLPLCSSAARGPARRGPPA